MNTSDSTKVDKAENRFTRFGEILDNSFHEIFIFDAKTLKFVQVNHGARKNIGYTMDELKQMTPVHIKPYITDTQFAELIAPLVSGEKELIQFETMHQRKGGTQYPVEIRYQLMRDEESPVYVASVQDITERKTAQAEIEKHQNHLESLVESRTKELKLANKQLLHTEKLVAISKLTASFAHEFNNPLFCVKNVLAEIKNGVTLDADYSPLLDLAIKESERMRRLIKNLLDSSRPTEGVKISYDIHLGITETLDLMKPHLAKRRITINKAFDKNLPSIKVVPDQIKQVILNVLQNAEEAIQRDEGGLIEITTQVLEGKVKLSIKDNGIGIKPDDGNRIYDPFFTTKAEVKGTGLGLSICHGIIKAHNGELDFQSQLGAGTTMNITLPLDSENVDTTDPSASHLLDKGPTL